MSKTLPRGWQEFKLKDICNIQDGIHTTPNYVDKGIKFISVENISDIYASNKFISNEDYNNLYKVKAKKNDIFMTRIGDIGTPAIVTKDEELAYYVTLTLLTNISKEIYYKYLYYAIQSYNFQKELYSRTLHVAFPKKINLGEIGECKFISPPIDEQKRIAEVLSLCDDLIENLTKLIEKKEIYKKGVMQRVLSGEVRFNGFTDKWKEYKLENIGMSYGGLTNKNASDFIDKCNAKYITYKSIYDCNKIDIKRLEDVYIEENEKQNLVQYGDAFFTISSETPDEVAISSVLLDEVKNTYLNSFCFGFRFDFNILVPEFARYYFRSNYVRKYTYKLSQGSTRFNLSKNKFLEMIVKLPSIDEQKKIGELLSLIDQDIDNLKQLLHLRKLQKKGLMQKLLTGEVRI